MAFDIVEDPDNRLLLIQHWESADDASVVEATMKMGSRMLDPRFKRILVDVRKSKVRFELATLAENTADFFTIIAEDAHIAYVMNRWRHEKEAELIRRCAVDKKFGFKLGYSLKDARKWLLDQPVDGAPK